MDIKEVAKRVDAVVAIADVEYDNEQAHCLEDQLWCDVLTAIAEGNATPSPALLAREAVRTAQLTFQRWYA